MLAKELAPLAEATEDDALGRLCQLLQDEYSYPVDSIVVSPEFELLGQKSADLAIGEGSGAYVAFLRRCLGRDDFPAEQNDHEHQHRAVRGMSRGAPRELTLTPDAPDGAFADLLEPKPMGRPMYTLDATAFADGGTLEIELRVGNALPTGGFELYLLNGPVSRPTSVEVVGTVQHVAPGKTYVFRHEFQPGAVYHLAARADDDSGQLNAFSATVTVQAK